MKAAVLLAAGAVGAVSLLGITSCSSDKDLSVPSDQTLPNITVPSDQTLPDGSIPGISIPDISLPGSIPGLTGECATFYNAFASAFTGANESTFSGLPDALDNLKEELPEDLHDDLDTVGEAFTKLAAVYEKYDYDPTRALGDPEFQSLFSDSEFTQASANISEWLDENCQQS